MSWAGHLIVAFSIGHKKIVQEPYLVMEAFVGSVEYCSLVWHNIVKGKSGEDEEEKDEGDHVT